MSVKKTEPPPRHYERLVVAAVCRERCSADMSDAEIKRFVDFAGRVAAVAWRLHIKVPATLPKNSKYFGMIMDAFWADIGFELILEQPEFRRPRGRPPLPEKDRFKNSDAAVRHQRL
jgi:hypothetical protein